MPTEMSSRRRKPIVVSAPNPKRWTRKECEFLVKNELLIGRYELINGEILSKMGQNPPHAVTIRIFTAWLTRVFGELFVQSQLPIDVAEADPDHNEPEPDAAVLVEEGDTYISRHPGPGDLRLVGEVSDTTLRFDLNTKAALYARAGIQEYWVIDIVGRRVIVHRNPELHDYQSVVAYDAEEEVSPLVCSDASVRVSELLPPMQGNSAE